MQTEDLVVIDLGDVLSETKGGIVGALDVLGQPQQKASGITDD